MQWHVPIPLPHTIYEDCFCVPVPLKRDIFIRVLLPFSFFSTRFDTEQSTNNNEKMRQPPTKDWYKILKVSRGATTDEIKTAYRKMALALHPDRHDGCEIKTKQFKEASEAYNILTDIHRRREYDLSNGAVPPGWYNKNRRRAPPSDYRKVYAPHAPPTGKWHDAQKHYDMHYGEGQFREAVKNAYKRAEAAGEFDYTSPLGKGFSFETHEERKARYGKDSIHGMNKNPYSWEQQGPPSQQYKYEESYVGEAKTVIKRRESIVHKLHERRQERMERESKVQASSSSTSGHPGQRIYHPFNQGDAACQIM